MKNLLEELKKLEADLLLQLPMVNLKQELLEIPFDSINVHASLLPKYRGAAPIQRAI